MEMLPFLLRIFEDDARDELGHVGVVRHAAARLVLALADAEGGFELAAHRLFRVRLHALVCVRGLGATRNGRVRWRLLAMRL